MLLVCINNFSVHHAIYGLTAPHLMFCNYQMMCTTDCSVIDGNSVRLLLCEEPFIEWSNLCYTALMNAEKLVFN